MARTPLQDRTPLAQWLIRSRESQAMTADGLLAALHDTLGWAPHRSNYAQWESGKVTPDPANLARVESFYARLGVAGPESPAVPAESAADPVAAAIDRQTAVLAQLLATISDWRAESRGQASATADALGLIAGSLGALGLSAAAAAPPPAARESSRPGR